jgi:hypothetical protein
MLGLFLAFAEYYEFLDKEVEHTRYTQRHEVTYDNIPAIYALKEEQEEHLDGKTRQGCYVENNKVLEKTFYTPLLYPIVPDKEIGAYKVAHHGKLKRNHGRQDIASKVVAAEDKVGTQPKHECIDTRAKITT